MALSLSDHELQETSTPPPYYPSCGLFERWRRSRPATVAVVALALFTDMIVYGVVIPVLPELLKTLGGDESTNAGDLGVLFGSYAFGLLVMAPVFGFLSDRYNTRRIPMLSGLLGLAIATVLFAFATNYWQLFLARLAQGISGGASWSIGFSMIADVYPAHELGHIMGAVLGANTLGFLLGPPLGGASYQLLGPRAPFFLCASLAFLDFLARLMVIPPVLNEEQRRSLVQNDPGRVSRSSHSRTSSEASRATTRTPVGLWTIIRSPSMLLIFFATIVVSAANSGLEPTLPLHLRNVFHADELTTGMVFIALVIPNIFVSIIAGHMTNKYGGKIVSSIGMVFLALVTPLIALPTTYGWLTVLLMLSGAASAVSMTPFLPEMADFVISNGGGGFGTVYALFNMAYSVGMLFGPVLGGYWYQSYGFFYQNLAYALIILSCVPFMLYAAYQQRTTRYSLVEERVDTPGP